jgi:hypothetical protein
MVSNYLLSSDVIVLSPTAYILYLRYIVFLNFIKIKIYYLVLRIFILGRTYFENFL